MEVVNWQDGAITASRRITPSGGSRRTTVAKMSVSKQNIGHSRLGTGLSAARSRIA